MSDFAIFPPHRDAVITRNRASIALAAIIAIGLLGLIRGPFWLRDWADDPFYSEVALLWRQGFLPYVHAFDVKPPGIFAVLSLAQTVFGPTRTALRLVGGLSDVLTMTLLVRFAWQRGALEAGVIAACLFAWFMNVFEADDCYSLLIALTTLAMMLAMSDLPASRRAVTAGLAIGAAGVVKQTAAFEGLAILLLLMRSAPSAGGRVKSAVLYVGCALVVPILFALYFAYHGALLVLLTDTVGIALQRPGAGSDHVTFIEGIGRFLLYGLYLSPLLAFAAVVVAIPSWFPRFRTDIFTLRYWFLASLASVIVQRALLAAYLAPMLPSVTLLVALGLVARLETRPTMARRILALAVAVLGVASLIRFAVTKPDDMSGVERAAAAVHAAHPVPDDRLYVIGAGVRSTWLYVATGLRPPLAFIIPSQQACNFPNVGPSRIDEAFATRPRFIITEREDKRYGCETENIAARIRAALAQNYRVIAEIGGTAEHYNLYELTPPRAP